MSIQDWPANERPRERLLTKGAHALSDAELLAIFLRTGTQGKSALELARDLLAEFDGFRSLLQANQQQFCSFNGLGPAKFALLQAVLEMVRRHIEQPKELGNSIQDIQTAKDFLHAKLRDYPYEVFACLFLDNRHRVLGFETLFRGTINGASVHTREIAKTALSYNASALILTHNHPSGDPTPSAQDRAMTKQVHEALGHLDVRVLDHIVVGDQSCIAFSEQGWI